MKLTSRPTEQKGNVRNRLFSLLLSVGIFLESTNKAQAEPPSLENEIGIRVGLPPTNTCDPYRYPTTREIRLARGVKYDEHGHAVSTDTKDCVDQHPKVELGASYLFAPDLGKGHHEGKAGDHQEEAEKLEGATEMISESEKEEHHSHPKHRFKLQAVFLVQQRMELAPKIELALPGEKEPPQFGFGLPVAVHLGGYHEIGVAWITRFSRNRLETWEFQAIYSARLFGPIAASLTCMAEGHEEEVHGGCGFGLGIQMRRFNLNFDGAWGPENFQHYHLSVAFAVGGAGGHSH